MDLGFISCSIQEQRFENWKILSQLVTKIFLGPKYAMMAMKALIATVLRKYRVFTEYKSPEDIRVKADLMLKPADGYKLSLEYRDK